MNTIHIAIRELDKKVVDTSKLAETVKANKEQTDQTINALQKTIGTLETKAKENENLKSQLDQVKGQLQKAEEASKAQAKDITGLKANLNKSAEAAQKAKEILKQLADQDKELKDALKSLQETVKKNKADQDNQMKRIEADMTHPSSQSQGDKGSVQVDQTGQVSVTKPLTAPTDHQKGNPTEQQAQSTQKNEKKPGEKKEGKDKSLDRSNEGKGKSLPKTGLTSMGAVIGRLGTLISSIGGFFFYKNKKKG